MPASQVGAEWEAALPRSTARGAAVLWAIAALTVAGIAVRFASLGLQSYHHDEVITAMRVIPGSFAEMLHAVKTSESNPPLYYVLAWGWAKAFGTGEFGLRSLSALFGAATVPVGYLIGRQLASRRTGLILAALLAFNPMLIWYSQEARSYALLVFFGALSMYFFVRSLQTRRGRDLALWALTSALALCSHYFAVFAVAIEAAWLLVGAAPPLAPGPARGGSGPGDRRGAVAADRRPGQPDPHRLDRRQPALDPPVRDRGQLPDRRNRLGDRRAAQEPLRAGPGDPLRRRPAAGRWFAAATGSSAARRSVPPSGLE